MGVNVPVEELRREYQAILLAGGAEHPRDLRVPGRELKGVHFAMEFLPQQNRRNEGDEVPAEEAILAGGKHVVIIGGGDTGADCLGTCHRQGAASVTQFELLPKPARPARRVDALAALAHAIALGKRARRRRKTRLERLHHRVHRRRSGSVKQLHGVRVGPPPKLQPLPARNSRWTWTWCCSRWASWARCRAG